MSEDLPTPERLGRIERGVQRRIDRRRQVAQQIAGASVAVLLVVGGVALARPLLLSSAGGSASSAGGTSAETSAASGTAAGRGSTVRCHDGAKTRTVGVGGGDLRAAVIAACVAALPSAATAGEPEDRGASPVPSPTAVLCESSAGVLHVYLRDPAACTTHGLLPFAG